MGNEYTEIRIDIEGAVAQVVLNKPEKLNAMAPAFFDQIGMAFAELDANDDVRAIVLRAEGRMFTAGLDLKAAAGLLGGAPGSAIQQGLDFRKRVKHLQGCFSAIQECRKPVIAAVHNHCIGGGVDLCTACDIILCSEDATFSIHETKIAIVADVGTLQRLSKFVGRGFAREMAFTGKRIGAERALASGLVNSVHADREAVVEAALEMAREIAANSPLAVQGTKIVLNFSDEHSVEEGLEYVAQWNTAFIKSQDLGEAMAAFMQKREPNYKGE